MNQKKILIIDDDIDLVEAMRISLEDAGFEVIDAQDGARGVQLTKSQQPDLIILDVMMGTQDEGFHIAYQIRNDPEIADIPIVMLTAVGQETGFDFDKEKDEDFLPVEEFLEKPVDPNILIETVRKNLGS
ncbi:MAG TPA: response regulator [Caldithrix abyssi]|uniref:Response regulator n=1 Tax=Caldithrix abyssi TaxID=187145 RepID=A0A7V5PR79_CALAY|nr:response regulator [Caldithrix abyssi]